MGIKSRRWGQKVIFCLFGSIFCLLSITPSVLFAGSIVAWGINGDGQATPPAGNDFVAIAAGGLHSLALKSDGSIVAWGSNGYGQATPPAGNNFIDIAAGWEHSLALKSDGSIVGWGYNYYGQATPPAGNNFIAIAAGGEHSLALKSDGSIVGWGDNGYGQATPPAGNNFIAIAAGGKHSLALKSDGSIVAWGDNYFGQATPPAGNNFIAISAGEYHSLALKSHGSIVGWGAGQVGQSDYWPHYGQATPPDGNNFIAIAAGGYHSLALKSDGSIVGWGYNYYGQATPPAENDFVAIAAEDEHSLGLVGSPPPDPPEPNIPAIPPPTEPNNPSPSINKLIYITHGWDYPFNLGLSDWTVNVYNGFNNVIDDDSWCVFIWRWNSKTLFPWEAMAKGFEEGKLLAKSIVDANRWEHVHLIGHSAGSAVIGVAAQALIDYRAEGKFSGTIHLTFLDPYTPFDVLEGTYGSTLGPNDWSENYFNTNTPTDFGRAGELFDYAHNVDLTNIGWLSHGFPCDWYYATITGQYPNGNPLNNDNIFDGRPYGFPRSLEAGDVNWQESLTLPLGNKPAVGSVNPRKMKAVSKLNQILNNSLVHLKEQNKGVILENLLRMWTNSPGQQQQLLTPTRLGNPLMMWTNSPMWGQVLVEMPPGTNSVKFTYQFTGVGPGYLTVYFNENLILIGDQRFDGNTPHESPQILVADFMQEDNWLTFRIDEINEPNAEVSISNLEIGTITTKTDINADLIVNFADFASFAQVWSSIDCNNKNSWCGGADFDEDSFVDFNDAVALASSWLWTPPKGIQADLNITGTVDFYDFNIFAGQWGEDCSSPDWCYGSDFNKSSRVDSLDLAEFAEHWLAGF
jgi:hypothetical protein